MPSSSLFHCLLLNVGVSYTVLPGYWTLTSSALTSPWPFVQIGQAEAETPAPPPLWHTVATGAHIALLPIQSASELGVD